VTAAGNFEYVAEVEVPTTPPSLVLGIANANGEPTNRVRVGETLSLSAQFLTSDNTPLINQIVEFQTSVGDLSPQSSLTNNFGIASTVFTPGAELGAGTVTATTQLDESVFATSQNIEVLAADASDEDTIRLGVVVDSEFTEGVLGIDGFAVADDVSISAGGTIGLNIAVVDSNGNLVLDNVPVSFSSVCVTNSDATVDQVALAINGIARSTFQDLSCAGANGSTDVITASITVNGVQSSVSRVVNLQAESVGSITFIDAQPANIVLAGSGGQNASTVSTVTFQVNGALGNPLAQQAVNFALNTGIGGLTLSPEQGLTNSDGQVSTRVTAGNVPTAVRVTAEVSAQDDTVLQTQSELLSVNTGLPDQNSISLALSDLNPEAFSIFGVEVDVTARLSDSFNNPVPDGTAVSFIAEGGSIEPSCTTVTGTCSVTWTSAQPRIESDHRVTILATAVGHETLADGNGDNQYSEDDGPALLLDDGSGFQTVIPSTTGFIDLPEAWLDNDENGILNGAEPFLDFNNSGEYDAPNGVFDGPQCANGCGANSLHVRRAAVLVTSSSAALLSISANGTELANNTEGPVSSNISLPRGSSVTLTLAYSDTAGQPIASGSSINFTSNAGLLSGNTEDVMPQTNSSRIRTQSVTLTNDLAPDDTSIDATVTVEVTSPSGVVSALSVIVVLE
jgi:hypothetical protein